MSRLSPITPKQQAVLDYVREHIAQSHRAEAPTQQQIGTALGFSRGTAQKYLVALHHKGLIELSDRPRGITVLENGSRMLLTMAPRFDRTPKSSLQRCHDRSKASSSKNSTPWHPIVTGSARGGG